MRKTLLILLAAILCTAGAIAQENRAGEQYTLAVAWDLDGEAADPDQVVTSATLADSTNYTIAANPDTCRLVDITVTDADSSTTAGVLTVTGTDCWGDALVATFTFAAGGSGVKTLTVSSGSASGAYFKTVAAVATGVLTGEGVGDALTVGYTTNSPNLYPLYGVRRLGPLGKRWVDITASVSMPNRITTSGSSSTTVTAVSNNEAFASVAVGDLLIVRISGQAFERKVTARASANSVTIDQPITIPTAGEPFSYRQFFAFTDPLDGWIPVVGYDAASFVFDVLANANTGGVVSTVECKVETSTYYPQVQVDTVTVASGTAGDDTSSIDLRLAAFTHCRLGAKFGTGDDADTAPENLYVVFLARR